VLVELRQGRGAVPTVRDLMALSPALLAVLDVPADQPPAGLTHMKLREIAKMASHAARVDKIIRIYSRLLKGAHLKD
jgi:hypothetical protein